MGAFASRRPDVATGHEPQSQQGGSSVSTGGAVVDWKKIAIDKAKIATDLDHEATAMDKDREAQVGSHHCSRASTALRHN
jgi:hypothetical protein